MRLKFIVTLLVVLGLAVYLGGQFTRPLGPPSKGERMKHFVACFRAEMDPTEEQIRELKEKILTDDDAILALDKELRKATEALESKLETPGVVDADLLGLYSAVEKLRGQMSENHFKRMLVLRSILTPEQQKKFLVCKRKMGPPALPHE